MKKTIKVSDLLDNSDVTIVGDSGGRSKVTEGAYRSYAIPGTIIAETEHGSLYLPANEAIIVEFY